MRAHPLPSDTDLCHQALLPTLPNSAASAPQALQIFIAPGAHSSTQEAQESKSSRPAWFCEAVSKPNKKCSFPDPAQSSGEGSGDCPSISTSVGQSSFLLPKATPSKL